MFKRASGISALCLVVALPFSGSLRVASGASGAGVTTSTPGSAPTPANDAAPPSGPVAPAPGKNDGGPEEATPTKPVASHGCCSNVYNPRREKWWPTHAFSCSECDGNHAGSITLLTSWLGCMSFLGLHTVAECADYPLFCGNNSKGAFQCCCPRVRRRICGRCRRAGASDNSSDEEEQEKPLTTKQKNERCFRRCCCTALGCTGFGLGAACMGVPFTYSVGNENSQAKAETGSGGPPEPQVGDEKDSATAETGSGGPPKPQVGDENYPAKAETESGGPPKPQVGDKQDPAKTETESGGPPKPQVGDKKDPAKAETGSGGLPKPQVGDEN